MTSVARDEAAWRGTGSEVAPRVAEILDNPDFNAIARRVTITVEEAASLLGIGRSAAYDAARRGQLPTRRLGRRLFVPVPAFLAWLGFTADGTE